MNHEYAISVSNVGKTYRSRDGADNTVLKGLDFHVEPGQFVSIVGQSGSGKTTLLKTISGLQDPTEGEILVKGRPIREGVEDIAMVFQSPVLLPWRNNLDNVLLPLEFRGTRDGEAERYARELLDMVGLGDRATRYSYELSGGMQQRVAICRALVSHPELLLMDEPFGALDAMTRDSMNIEIQRIWRTTGCSVLFVTHSIPEAVWLADRVVVVGDRPGRIVADVEIDLPRPRGKEHRFSPAFSDYATEIESHIGVTAGIS
ncbi:Hydroxymethylpyrimidine ABC transporter, ATPase component [Pseudonocardia sp. Ae168_Ps1]|uniref:ABC transporter ATP-binding protein n=1 Tax=unclassified Pseudonocardia TaxID=2619320 RepID=UPI0006CB7B25|nr:MULTISPECIES: ABC transporter ATP-binding protein [unclassified Pseudonocardia]ALE75372.1 nitrate ABC transporter ATPase [Pseudonocardia sp. EC080625-04]ALL74733.1 nitrate ABC transporter ATPase [Pseudonocardia sp. EC080610-09]ALL81755.1 nitrate ABC transporter ATPase [Pseudonocardia sp. EC080619-01]OLL76498.1 Hydroxymethylpyrimidine ABC transporter, ATPase component [Pseudonocardia sp. Ae150A_Ps1]OLL82508.1 Hydroxymethylpyrimidine ABC transporter, ATPase component [Pseudonocardia sp. Ae168